MAAIPCDSYPEMMSILEGATVGIAKHHLSTQAQRRCESEEEEKRHSHNTRQSSLAAATVICFALLPRVILLLRWRPTLNPFGNATIFWLSGPGRSK
jgi:hypothetical protein